MAEPTYGETIRAIQEAYDKYATALGYVVHYSNSLGEGLAGVYAQIVGGDTRIAMGVWHSVLSDKTQRDMLRGALLSVPEHKWERRLPKAREDLKWLINEADKFANKRNDAVHAPAHIPNARNRAEVSAVMTTKNHRAMNLKNKALLEEFELYSGIAVELHKFAFMAIAAISNNSRAWPDKPLLPTRGQRRSPA